MHWSATSIDPSSEQSTTAVLDKISGAALIGARQRQARMQLLAGIVEQLLVDSKRARDTDTAATEHAARRRGATGGPRPRHSWPARATPSERGGSRKRRVAEESTWQLNLLPTIQQAISSLLTTYEPEFLRFGHRLFLSFATIIIAWHGIQMMFSRDGLGDSMFEFAKLLLFVSFGYALIAFYESPLPGIGVSFSNLITDQAFYFQSILEARSFDNIYQHFDELSDRFIQPDAWSILANLIYWIVLLLVAFAKAHFDGGHRVRSDRQRRVRAARAAVRAVLHRPEARLAVLGMVQGVHPVLVHSGRGHRVPDGVRAVHLPLRDNLASGHHGGGIWGLRPAGGRRYRHVLHRHPARAVADELDILRSRR